MTWMKRISVALLDGTIDSVNIGCNSPRVKRRAALGTFFF
jgi:hypothetical protein